MAIEIRPLQRGDEEAAGEALRASWMALVRPGESDWTGYIDHVADVAGRAGRSLVLVAVDDATVVGSATLEMGPGRIDDDDPPLPPEVVEVRMVGVHPGAQRRGIGRALMDASIAEARRRGKTLITLHSAERHTAAHAMYEAMGFARGEDRVFDDGFRLRRYSLPIA